MLMLLGIEITFQDRLSCLSCLDISLVGWRVGGGVLQHDDAPAHTAVLTKMFCLQMTYM